MDDFVLLGLAALIAFFLGPIGFFMALGLRRRVTAVEGLNARVAALEAELARVRRAPKAKSAAPAPASTPTPEAPPPLFAEPPPAEVTSPIAAVEAETTAPPPPSPETPTPTAPSPLPKQTRPIGLEEKLGAHWAVIVGGIALALGGLLLVKYSIESGFFGPGARVIAGLILGLGLVAGGEVLRRRERTTTNAAGVPIPAVLTGAGTVAAFGSLYAAHALYGFIGPGPAFILMGAVGVATMLAAALHGPGLAGLGLIGALGAPLLVTSNEPNPWPVVLFVAIVCAAAYGLARLRRWLWLAIAAAVGAAIWQVLFLLDLAGVDFAAASLVHLVVETALVLAAFVWMPHRETPAAEQSTDQVGSIAALGAAAAAAIVLAAVALQGFDGSGWIVAAALVVAMPALTGARLPAVAVASAGAGLLVLVVLAFCGAKGEPPEAFSPIDWLTILPHPKDLRLFEIFGVVASAALGALATRRLLDRAPLSPLNAAIYAGSGVLTPLGAVSIAYLRSSDFQSDARLAATAGVLAFAMTAVATLFRQRADADARPGIVLGLGASAAGAFAALALGLVFLLSQGTLTVALALSALAAAFVGERLAIRALRWAAMGLAIAVAGRLAYDPRIVGDDLGRTILFNWLLFGYGVPAVAFGLAARLMRRSGDDPPLRVTQALAILCSALLVVFEIRHAMNNGDPFAPTSGMTEQGLMAIVGILFSLVLMELGALRDDWLYRTASLCFSVIAIGQTIGLLLWQNPYFSGERIEGGALFNGLILGYLVPAFAAFVFARRARARPPQWRRQAATAAAIALVFAYVNLELRRLFQGRPAIGFHIHTGQGEFYAYSALWLGLGILLLAYGVLARSKPARLASAALVAATVFKVFVFDLAGLEGVLRALSFLGLGAALIGIGLVYQRLLFPRAVNESGAPAAPPASM
jgi:uncharacterized membrane protein